ncbi:MAG: alpha/beta hydrolase family esterase [Polyangiales bacterium]
MFRGWIASSVVCLASCHREPARVVAHGPAPSTIVAPVKAEPPSTTVGGDRPATVFVPSSHHEGAPIPLVVLLHGYGVSGDLVEWVFRLKPVAEKRGFLYVHPDGAENPEGKRYWNATDACCAPGGQGPDDVAYLQGLVTEIAAKWSVDPRRIFLVGHSNGAMMAQRLACDHSELFAAVVSVAGTSWADASRCVPGSPVSILEVHGTADGTVRFDGGQFFGKPYPGARAIAQRWAGFDGCDPSPLEGPTLDLDREIEGPESKTLAWQHCRAGSRVELWPITGGSHIPAPTDDFRAGALDFLFSHPKI